MNVYRLFMIVFCLSRCSCAAVSFQDCSAVGHIGVRNPEYYGSISSNDIKIVPKEDGNINSYSPSSGMGMDCRVNMASDFCSCDISSVLQALSLSHRMPNDIALFTNTAYMIVDPDVTFPCCGVIEEWTAYVKETGSIHFEIWRSTGNDIFQLVGSNLFSPAVADREITMNVPSESQYTVYPGDYIGWYTAAKGMIAYTPGVGGEATDVRYSNLRPSSLAVGSNFTWSAFNSQGGNTYAIRARYGINKDPTFLNLDAEIKVTPPVAIGTVIYTVNASDNDISDTTITQLTYSMTTASSDFSFDNATRKVSVLRNLSREVGYHCLNFTVKDICLNTATGRLCILIHNDPPSVVCNPNPASVVESTTGNKNIITMQINDVNGDAITCSLTRTNPTGSPFNLQENSFPQVYTIYTNANPNFRRAILDNYSVYITCTDGKNFTSVVCGVRILPSEPPVITNLPTLVTLTTSNANTDTVIDVTVTDVDSTTFNYSMTCDPTNCPFKILNTGHIQLNKDLRDHTVGGYDLHVTVTDGYSSVTRTLSVRISGINVAPQFKNLPPTNTLTVPENIAFGSSIYPAIATDINGDALTYSMTSSPAEGIYYFSIGSSDGLISTSATNTLNFEAMTNNVFTMSVSVTDGKLSTTSTFVVRVLDVNEGLSFQQNTYRIQANESVKGTQLSNPGFIVIDNDNGDTVTYLQDCDPNTGYISMNPNSGLLTFAVNYDLDLAGFPSSITCIVTATDKGGLTATATLSININEINDHVPTFKFSSYTFNADNNSPVGRVLGNVSATDADIGTNGQFVFSTDQTTLSKSYFEVSSTGHVLLQSSLNGILAGTELPFRVLATDAGFPSLQGSTTVTVIVNEGTTTAVPTTTAKYKTFFNDERNIVWVAMVLITGLAVVAITSFICWRYIRDWPSNFDPLRNCTTKCRKIDCCKDIFQRCSEVEPQQEFSSPRKNLELQWQTPPSSPELSLPRTLQPQSRPVSNGLSFKAYPFWKRQWIGNI